MLTHLYDVVLNALLTFFSADLLKTNNSECTFIFGGYHWSLYVDLDFD